jgi:tRNA A-37 threonylcarbamoyl transferase component Bud32
MELQTIRGKLLYGLLGLVVLVFLGDVVILYDMIDRNQKQAQQIHVLQRAVQSNTDETKRLHNQLITTNSQNKALLDELKKQILSIQNVQKKANSAF